MSRILAIALLLLFSMNANSAQPRVCSREEARRAEDEAARLPDWKAVYRSFKRYAHCDDGAIGEGYSDSVGGLRAREWIRLDELRRLTSSDKRFEQFVLRHVDETIPADELKLIVDNARFRCPAKAERLCRLIEARARQVRFGRRAAIQDPAVFGLSRQQTLPDADRATHRARPLCHRPARPLCEILSRPIVVVPFDRRAAVRDPLGPVRAGESGGGAAARGARRGDRQGGRTGRVPVTPLRHSLR